MKSKLLQFLNSVRNMNISIIVVTNVQRQLFHSEILQSPHKWGNLSSFEVRKNTDLFVVLVFDKPIFCFFLCLMNDF